MRLLPSGFTPLHGLRILAFLAVFQIRTSGQLYWRGLLGSTWWSVYSATSIYGMDFFFFFLSGFLIGTMLLANPPAGPGDLGRFYARRQFRILPPYFVVLLLLSLARGAWPWPQEMLFLTNYPSNRSYLMVWSWSLSVEEHFYLIAPRLFVLVFRALSPGQIAALLGGSG